MRADLMTWVQRVVAAVFLVGAAGLVALVVSLVRQAQGIPPLPVYAGLIGLAALILLAGACLALISIAISTRRGADALRRLAQNGGLSATSSGGSRVFSSTPLREVVKKTAPDPEALAESLRPARPAGRTLVAER